MKRIFTLAFMLISAGSFGQITLSGTSYTQNFDGVGSGLPAGFQVAANATNTSLGTAAAFTNAATAWNSTASGWKNYASADGLVSGSTATDQSNSSDRVVAIRQSGTVGDPGAALEMQLANTIGFTGFSLNFKLQSLDVASPRTTTFRVDYGFGASPSAFTVATTAPVTITTGGSSFTNTTVAVNFGTALDNSSQPVWIRIIAVTASTGSGNRPTSGIDDLVLNYTGGAACTPPVTQASAAALANITASSFDINWTAGSGTNSLVVIKQGSAVSGTPNSGTAYTANTIFGAGQTIAGGEYVVYNGTGNTVSVTGLALGTTYHVAVFSFNSADNCYNTTAAPTTSGTTSCAEPTVQVSTITITPGSTTASINWSGGNGNSSLVRFNSVNSFTAPLDGTTYTANTVYGSGEQTVYSGTGSAVSVSGLTASTTYYVTVYTFNSCGGTPDYLSTSNTVQSFTTTAGGGGIPPGYYDPAVGLTCAPLKTALSSIITTGMAPKTYGDLWTQYLISDVKPREVGPGTSPTVIWDIYSDNPTGPDPYNFTPGTVASGGQQDNGSAAPTEGILYNREHSIPQSWFGASASSGSIGPESDYFHVFPTDKVVNANRGNFVYGEVSTPSITSQNGSKLGPNTVTGMPSSTSFEPINAFKGDLARAFFYFVTRYQSNMPAWQTLTTEGNLTWDGTTWPSIELPYLRMMLRWHSIDPVSQKEIDRNDAGYIFQSNRNPYVDHPEYVSAVWSSSCGLLLPTELTVFEGRYTSNTVFLNWTIEKADGFSHFEVERSVDGGRSYQRAGTIQWISGTKEYSFADNVAAFDGKILYRLKLVDINRVFSYSRIIAVTLPGFNGDAVIFPNPAKSKITVSFRKAATAPVLAMVYDAAGRNVYVANWQGGQTQYTLDISRISNGQYLLRTISGGQSSYTQFVIQK